MKVERKINIRVEVEPRTPLYYLSESSEKREKYEFELCRGIEEQIKRHVDDVDYISIMYENYAFCSYCENEWEEDEHGCPLCCNEAITEWREAQ